MVSIWFGRSLDCKMVEVKAPYDFQRWMRESEIVPQHELQAWRATLKKDNIENCPDEVQQFIHAVAAKLDDFGRIGQSESMIDGEDLLLCGMKEVKGEKIYPWVKYPINVPHMVAVDHHAAMYKAFHRKGKQGLIDYVKARLKGTDLERLLDVLSVHVFKEDRPEFKKVLDDINAAKKL